MIESINEWGQIWLRYLAFSVAQNTLFLAVIFLILHRMRSVSARFRYIIAFIGITKLFLPNVIPAPIQIHLSRSAETAVSAIPVMVSGTIPAAAAAPATPAFTTAGLLFAVWLAVAGTLILLPAVSTLRLKLRLRDACLLPADGLLPSGVSLCRSEKVAIPMSIGLFPREIYVPGNWEVWSPECRAMILSHELAHIQRLDGLARFVQSLAGALYFFHPLVWLLNRRVDELREMACDDSSISQGRSCSSVTYSRALVEIAETMTSPGLGCGSASALIKKRQELYNRIRYQMEARMKTISTRTGIMLITIVMAAGFMLSFRGTGNPSFGEDTAVVQDGKGIITGTVVDEETGDPLNGANVMIENKTLGAASNSKGQFRITGLTAGTYTLYVSFMGYESTFTDVTLKKEETVTVRVPMRPKMLQADTVVTTPGTRRTDAERQVPEATKVTGEQTAQKKPAKQAATFVAFDKEPVPVGGWNAIQQNLVYPEAAEKAGIEGTVRVATHIGIDGTVLHTKILEALNGCNEAAMDAIKKTKFTPAMQREQPVEVWVQIPVQFTLDKKQYGRIRGQVFNEKTKDPIPDVIITIAPTSLEARTDKQGIYVIDRVPPGTYTVSAITKKRLLAAKTDITLRAETTVFADFAIDPDGVFFVAFEEAPEPVGGWAGLQKNLVYPDSALKAGIEGIVRVNAHIDTAGNVLYTKILQGLDGGCNEAAMDVVKKTKWIPAMQKKGKPVEVWVAIPVRFQMKKDEESASGKPSTVIQEKQPIESEAETTGDEVFFVAFDVAPEPVDGWAGLQKHLVYPRIAQEAGIEGIVRVNTHIDTAGNVLHTKILQGLGGGCSEAAMEAVKDTKWKPALQKGKPVEVWVAIPVRFQKKN
ncbi:TonB family protein [bacterium]|nr:TonB family protein [bacterium]